MFVSTMDNNDTDDPGSITNVSNTDDICVDFNSGDNEDLRNDQIQDLLGISQNNDNEIRVIPLQKSRSSTDVIREIDVSEVQFFEDIGKGSFGSVNRAVWSGKTVAAKKAETEAEVVAFQNEIKQLAKVQHENIIKMYGVVLAMDAKYIILELATGGSLYQFLHCPPKHAYTLKDALSWLLQCATAITYLHSLEPKPIIHRDLKPLNLLLMHDHRLLKVCDFGTACDLRSMMTDNKGSTAWMAPEVIKSSNYNEKCDVYSWGMILWEVLTRRIPFQEMGQQWRILWQVANKSARPPLVQGCPAPIEDLMKKCWCDDPRERPSMAEVVDRVSPWHRIAEDAISQHSSIDSATSTCSCPANGIGGEHTSRDASDLLTFDPGPDDPKYDPTGLEGSQNNNDVRNEDELGKLREASVSVVVDPLGPPWGNSPSSKVPPSSSSHLFPVPPPRRIRSGRDPARRRSACAPDEGLINTEAAPKGHRRASSYESSLKIGFEPLSDEIIREGRPNNLPPLNRLQQYQQQHQQHNLSPREYGAHRVPYSNDETPRSLSSVTSPSRDATFSRPLVNDPASNTTVGGKEQLEDAFLQLLEEELKPAPARPDCPKSQSIYNEHKGLARDLFVVQEDIVFLERERDRLMQRHAEQSRTQGECAGRYSTKIENLKGKNDVLRQDYARLNQQLKDICSRRQQPPTSLPSFLPQSFQLSSPPQPPQNVYSANYTSQTSPQYSTTTTGFPGGPIPAYQQYSQHYLPQYQYTPSTQSNNQPYSQGYRRPAPPPPQHQFR